MSNRDEQGLTLSGRTILRFVVEFEETLSALQDINGSTAMPEVMKSPKVLAHIKTLMWIGVQMIDRIGSKKSEIAAYLEKHREEDRKSVSDDINKTIPKVLTDIFEAAGIKTKCPKCGEHMCLTHKTCHKCDGNTSAVHGPN